MRVFTEEKNKDNWLLDKSNLHENEARKCDSFRWKEVDCVGRHVTAEGWTLAELETEKMSHFQTGALPSNEAENLRKCRKLSGDIQKYCKNIAGYSYVQLNIPGFRQMNLKIDYLRWSILSERESVQWHCDVTSATNPGLNLRNKSSKLGLGKHFAFLNRRTFKTSSGTNVSYMQD